MNTIKRKILASVASTVCLMGMSMFASAAVVTTLDNVVNSFQDGGVTGGAQLVVDAASDTQIVEGTELLGFAFGTYDVDATQTNITMTFVNDPDQLGIAEYNATTFDRYFFEFDELLSSASISDASNPNFVASVELITPGSVFDFDGAFLPDLPNSFTAINGGFLVTIGDGTNLFNVGQGGSLVIDFTAVPAPPVILLILFSVAVFCRRQVKS